MPNIAMQLAVVVQIQWLALKAICIFQLAILTNFDTCTTTKKTHTIS